MRRVLTSFVVMAWVAWPVAAARADAVADDLAALDAAAPGAPRLAAAKQIVDLGPSALPALALALKRPLTATDAQRRDLLKKIGADVPNAKGTFLTPPRPTKPDAPELDWLAALAKLPQSPATDPALRDALETVTLLRAMAATHLPAAADAILEYAFSSDGLVFRDECGRQIRVMSPYSLATLLRATQDKKRDGGGWTRYASFQLDKLGKSLPSYCLSAAPDDEVEVEMLHAIRDVKHPDAVSAVLDRANSPSHVVRQAAREAWMAYVTGPPPPPAPKEFRKLPGGKLSDKQMPLYLTYRELADQELRRVLGAQTSTPPPEKATVEAMTKELFELYDNQRATMWDDDMKAAADLVGKGQWDEVVAKYDAILGVDPLYPRRSEMAAGYLEAGRRATDVEKAILLFHKAYSVDPAGSHSADARAALEQARARRGGEPVHVATPPTPRRRADRRTLRRVRAHLPRPIRPSRPVGATGSSSAGSRPAPSASSWR